MANTIALFKKYIDLLDEVYKVESKTSVLDMDSTLVRQGANANEIIIPKIEMDGLADYSRNSGYVSGNVTLTNETVKYNYDRGRKFTVDNMDNEETAGIAFGKLSSEFIRTKVVPELDAFRFATYAAVEGVGKTEADLDSGDGALLAILEAQNYMDELDVPADGRYLFITPTLFNFINSVDSYKSKAMLDNFTGIISVPKTRFYTAIDLLDGTTMDETAGGFKPAEGAKTINFMIVHKPAVLQYSKHTVNKIFTPEENQDADAWQFCYRAYGLADAYENKAAGIYLHCSETAVETE